MAASDVGGLEVSPGHTRYDICGESPPWKAERPPTFCTAALLDPSFVSTVYSSFVPCG